MKNIKPLTNKTKILHSCAAQNAHEGAVNIPVYRASTFLSSSVEEMYSREATPRAITYGRKGTPASRSLEDTISVLDGSEGAVAVSSGLQAVAMAVCAFVRPGDHILVSDSVYAPTRRFCNNVLDPMQVETQYFPPRIGADIRSHLRPNTRLILCESPGSHSFEIQDIPAISAAVSDYAATEGIDQPLIVADVTWSGLIFQQPFALGVDVAVQSATKYPSGHSDVMAGFISARTEDLIKQIRAYTEWMGCNCSADETYLLLRGMKTLHVRLLEHQASALKVADWLSKRPEVARVNHPGLKPSNGAPEELHADHALWQRDFLGASGLFSFEFTPRPKEDAIKFTNALNLFGIGSSFGGFESLVLPSSFSHRTAEAPGFQGPVVRLHIGLEDTDDLISDLEEALDSLGDQ